MSEAQQPGSSEAQVENDDLLASYLAGSNAYDEMIGQDGRMRPHWHTLVETFRSFSDLDRASAHDTAARMLANDGVTYVSQDSDDGSHTPWQLDLLPSIIHQSEWDVIEKALIQRAHLLNAVMSDIYGAQSLLKDGLIPPALVFGNPQFLRPCHGIEAVGGTHLHLLAFDLARSPDGQWWILNDRTQAPTGLGYALENRLITSRSLPDLFGSYHVRRLASFFQGFSENLQNLTGREEPIIGVLSPGPGIETYFEHAFLARYLGYSVVEGADLTVRDDRVYLKTVEGLKPVDLLLRRVDSDYCDPLELRTDSFSGVPNLVKAVRAGNVIVANSLGSGLLENDAINGFFPGLCRAVLNEEPLMPDVATWWCGQQSERDYVLDNLDTLVVRKAFRPRSILNPTRDTYVGPDLSAVDREALKDQISKYGYNYSAQEIVSFSTTPAWTSPHQVTSAQLSLRVFVAKTPDGYKAMPGGLARVSDHSTVEASAFTKGDFSKDMWVVNDEPVDTFSLLAKERAELTIRRSGRELPSRTADNLFWLGRYSERAEGAVRLYRALVSRLSGEFGPAVGPEAVPMLVKLLVSQKHLSKERAKEVAKRGITEVEKELWKILFDTDCPDGLTHILTNVQRTADLIRERLSVDTWRIIGNLCSASEGVKLRRGQELSDALELLDGMIQQLSAFNGMVMENMTRGSGWRFLDMGRRLERAHRGVGLLRNLAIDGDPERTDWLDLLLDLADSAMTYRTRYKALPDVPRVLDLLLADDANPRSIVYQAISLDDHIDALPSYGEDQGLSLAKRLTLGLRTDLLLVDVERIAALEEEGNKREDLDALLEHMDASLENLSDAVGILYFIHSQPHRISGPRWSEDGS